MLSEIYWAIVLVTTWHGLITFQGYRNKWLEKKFMETEKEFHSRIYTNNWPVAEKPRFKSYDKRLSNTFGNTQAKTRYSKTSTMA